MEKYIAVVLLLAPGYIAKATAFLLGGSTSKKGELEAVMVYFSYSLFSVSTTLLAAYGLGLIGAHDSWAAIETKFKLPVYAFKFLGISLGCSIAVGAFWQLKLESWIVKGFNWVNVKCFKGNEVFLSGSLFDQLFVDDKQDHFLVVEKSGKLVSMGILSQWSSPDSERVEFSLREHPLYAKWLAYAKTEEGNRHPLNNVKNVYFDVTNDMTIRELDFPTEWVKNQPESPPI